MPTQQGIGIPEVLHFNHGSALVLVYTDGSVLLAHGGIEMGQVHAYRDWVSMQ